MTDRSHQEHPSIPVNRPSPVPEAMHGGLFDVLSKARAFFAEEGGTQEFLNDEEARIAKDEALLRTRERIKEEVAGLEDDTIALIEDHIRDFPKEPTEGFDGVDAYGRYVSGLNRILAEEHAMFRTSPEQFRPRDPENPEKYVAHILCECADGRNMFTQFIPKEKMLGRFNTEWLPTAGNIIFPEINVPKSVEEVAALLKANKELRENLFGRLDLMYGPKIDESLQEYKAGDLSRVHIEFQSHFDGEHPTHGCGAHKSNLLAAQLEAIKDCLVTEEWLKDRYPEEYKASLFRVFRTTHDTGTGKPVYSASKIDKTLPAEAQQEHSALFGYAASHYEAPMAADREKGIIREYQGNPTGINAEEHDEQSIRLSSLHLASTLKGQSVLEVSWTNDPKTLFAHIKVLVGIIDRNYRKSHPDKPTIIHLDMVKGNRKIRAVAEELDAMLTRDPEIQAKLKEGSIKFWTTTTDRETFETDSLQRAA